MESGCILRQRALTSRGAAGIALSLASLSSDLFLPLGCCQYNYGPFWRAFLLQNLNLVAICGLEIALQEDEAQVVRHPEAPIAQILQAPTVNSLSGVE